MKKITTSFLALLALQTNAQVELYESFNAPFNPAAAGWNVQNLSSPVGTASWFQGNASFDALSGGPTDYFSVNFNSTSNTGPNNTISNWLITPTLNLVNGGIVQFATRTVSGSTFADRLQLYYSTAGNGTNVGATAGTATNTVGTFTNIILDINSAQLNSGYPDSWTVFTTTLSGISTPTAGRLAFRYYLTNGGAGGTTGNLLGIDEFRYSQPCSFAPTFIAWGPGQLCSGNPVSLLVMGAATTAITSYTWITGANTNTTTYVPQTNGVNSCYVLKETSANCVDLEVANLNVLASPTVSFVRDPNGNMCSGSSLTVAASGASTYTYLLNNVSSSTNPMVFNVPTVTSVASFSFVLKGSGNNNCVNTQTVQLVIHPDPTVTATGPTMPMCIGSTATLGATGASSYTWSGAATAVGAPLSYTATAPAETKNFTVTGESMEGCISEPVVVAVVVNPCTGIEENVNGKRVTVYPNPFSERLYFEHFSGELRLYNELGRLVMAYHGDTLKLLNTAELPAGVYLLQLTNKSGQSIYRKLVKQQAE